MSVPWQRAAFLVDFKFYVNFHLRLFISSVVFGNFLVKLLNMSAERVFGTEIQISTEDQGLEKPTDVVNPKKRGKRCTTGYNLFKKDNSVSLTLIYHWYLSTPCVAAII
jgi:hypothetical protein